MRYGDLEIVVARGFEKNYGKIFRKYKEKYLQDLYKQLKENPERGVIIQGSNNYLRKFRQPIPGKGKSGGVRIIYSYDENKDKEKECRVLFLIKVYKKGSKDNLSKQEINIFQARAEELIEEIT